MICSELIIHGRRCTKREIDLDRFTFLHPEGQNIIITWFSRSWNLYESNKNDCFEAFIYSWLAFNGWASCISGADDDCTYINSVMQDKTICDRFDQLMAVKTSDFASYATQFSEMWPIFRVQDLRARNLLWRCIGNRQEIVKCYLEAGASNFAPQCYQKHIRNNELIPVDWPHTIAALYRVRCNLLHGEKAAHSEMDQQLVFLAYRTLVHFLKEARYL